MYSYPDSEFYANVKVESSIGGQYENDKKTVINFAELNYKRKIQLVENLIKKNPKEKIWFDERKVGDL
jgi:hypothetical protein